MKRRDFLSQSGKAMTVAALAGSAHGVNMSALASSPVMSAMQKLVQDTDRVMVLIQLTGGNDGLNTVIPVDDALYYNARKNIAIPKAKALKLRDGLSLHPVMTGFRDLFNDGRLSIVQNVTYPNPDRSHFRGTDIWLTATDADVFKSTGWLGRYLQTLAPQFPQVMPTEPLAIQIGEALSLGFKADKGSLGITFRDPDAFYSLVDQNTNSAYDAAPATIGGAELDYVRSVEKASQVYSKTVKAAADRVKTNKVVYPQSNGLARSLQIVSRLIAGGLSTKLYLVSISGSSYDTHFNQGGENGVHAQLLSDLSEAVTLFLNDCKQLGTAHRVAGLTFSEFGRRVAENGSQGTDHGTAAPLFVFGENIIGGKIHGRNPDLVNLDSRGDLLMEYDYRQVYAASLLQWFGTNNDVLTQTLFREFSPLPLFQEATTNVESDVDTPAQTMECYPRPCSDRAFVKYIVPFQSDVTLTLLDLRGNTVGAVSEGTLQAGTHTSILQTSHLSSGTYFVRLRCGRYEHTSALHVQR